ncbi:MAG: NUMOD3 domain-containing DNA-binding protein [Candidatus Nanoarchaeia archaeon]|jgi:group I intron endonuclease|nr:NUMOD3 domain-containing DNA-binding protein [Candidatus Nanoarchaeia archaeon]
MSYIIYKTTNLLNQKIYVGKHYTSDNDGYLGSGKLLKLAIKKYGRENFIRETLELCTLNNANEREIFWIDKLNTMNRDVGYNITKGGMGGISGFFGKDNPNYGHRWNEEQRERARQANLGKTISIEQRKKVSDWNKINGNPFKGKSHSKTQKEKWSQERKGTKLGKENSFYGKTHSKESLKLIGQSSKLRTKYVYFFISPDNEEFNNILNLKDFCKQYGWIQNNLKFVNNEWNNYKNWKIKRVYKEN